MAQKQAQLPSIEQGLLMAMHAIDTQVAREMQRTPVQAEQQGVQKWEPFNKRIEQVSAFILDSLGEEVELDSILVLAHSFVKALEIIIGDLGTEGLGKVRSAYSHSTMEQIERHARVARQFLEKHERLVIS